MTKLKKTKNVTKIKTQLVTSLKSQNVQLKNSHWDKNQKLKWKEEKNCYKTHQLKLCQKSITKILTRLRNSNCDKTKKNGNCDKKKINFQICDKFSFLKVF